MDETRSPGLCRHQRGMMAYQCRMLVLSSVLLAARLLCPAGIVGQGYAPELAAGKMSVAEGLVVKLVASEPEVRQPILVKVDDRGRLWTIQYLQYPNPAGLKRVEVDRWSRAVYDRVPEPPPKGPRGADRITILEDTDGDGRADNFKDFVGGLNLATGLAFGHGGVYVLQVPYLLFYPDKDRDDVPDSDPEVLLEGFGMEDAQSLANHLTWGPDGWLYGVNGSTTTCKIRGVEFQQGVWRYQPLADTFELFCEGGGNTFGLTFDENGNLFYSTNDGPFVHAIQGAYYYKSFGKHGPLHNPYAYGFFDHVKRDQVPGGPPTGGTIYLGDSFPKQFRGKFMAGDFLGHTASWWDVQPLGTTFQARYGGVLLDSRDTWFGPTDMCLGPDGSIYVCDFHDQRTAHPDPDANWDRSNGRIYKIQAIHAGPARELDLHKLSSDGLVDLLTHSNGWYADRARVELAHRRDPSVIPRLVEMALQTEDQRQALEGLWALYVSAGLADEVAEGLLDHPHQYVRSWTVRLLGDERRVSPAISHRLIRLAETEPSPIVRCQLAATAKRLLGEDGLLIVRRIFDRDLDDGDSRIPWLLWWAIEDKAVSHTDRLLAQFARPEAWANASNRGNIRRLARRWAAEGTRTCYDACLQLLRTTVPDQLDSMHRALLDGLSERSAGLHGIGQGGLYEEFAVAGRGTVTSPPRRFDPLPPQLRQYISQLWRGKPSDPGRVRLAIRAEVDAAYQHVLAVLADTQTDQATCVAMLMVLAEFGRPDSVPVVLPYLDKQQGGTVRSAAVRALARFDDERITAKLLAAYPGMSDALQSQARDVLFSRPDSARAFIELVVQGSISAESVPMAQLRRIALHRDSGLDALVRTHWGNVQPGTAEEKLATMRRFNNDLRQGGGDPSRGKALFAEHCGKCHQLFGEGTKLGPDLTAANRGDRAALLANIVDPSAVIRREYLNYVVTTVTGRIVTGLIAEQDAASITVVDADNQRTRIGRDEIDSLDQSPLSLMPEKQLDQLQPQELRDLFSYLQK